MRNRENKIITVDSKTGRVRVSTKTVGEPMTQQQFKDQVEINNIINKYRTTGEMHHLNRSQGVYLDVSKITNLLEAHAIVQKASDAFMDLPADLRSRFENNPQKLIEFMQNPQNKDEAIELGLMERPIPPTQTQPTEPIKNDKTNQKTSSESSTIKIPTT
ncbi:internal scaffolding protein [Apis mellifera associated microvirus 20]|nr:internal scaffolding protein [Apis mellifera associated microvirus 20]